MLFLSKWNEGVVFGTILLGGLIFFAQELFSFIYHKDWISKKKVNYSKLAFYPYVRIIPMHITVIAAGVLKDKFDLKFESGLILALFLVLKTIADVGMYINMRKGFTYGEDK